MSVIPSPTRKQPPGSAGAVQTERGGALGSGPLDDRTLAALMVQRTSTTGACTMVDAQWLAFTGTTLESQLGDGWLECAHPDDRAILRRRFFDALAARHSIEMEYRLARVDGQFRRVLYRASACFADGGAFVGYIGIHVEIAIARPFRDVEDTSTALVLSQTRSINFAHLIACDPAGRVIAWHDGAAQLYGVPAMDAIGKRLSDVLNSELPSPIEEIIAQIDATGAWVGEVVHQRRNGSRIVVTSRWEMLRDAHGQSMVFVHSDTDMRALRSAEQALLAAENAMSGDIALLHAVSQSTRDPMVVKDADGRMLFVNPAALRMLAREEVDILGRTSFELFDAEAAALVWANDARVIESGREITVEESIRTPWGEATFLSTKSPLRDAQGAIVGVVGVSTDITERKRAERELAESERRYRAALRAVVGIVYELDAKTGSVQRSEGLMALVGVASDDAEPTAQWWQARIHPDDAAPVAARLEDALDVRGTTIDSEYRVRHAKGHWVTVWDRALIVRDEAQSYVGLIGNVIDVTARKRAEERLRIALEATKLGLWEVDLASGQVEYSGLARDIFAVGLGGPKTFDAWRDRIHPADLPNVDAALERMRAEPEGAPHSVECRLMPADAEATTTRQAWVQITARGVFEGRGDERRAARIVGTVLDVSHRKRADHALRDSEERFRMLVENIDDVFWIVDYKRRKQVYISPAYTRLWGFDASEVYAGVPRWPQRIHPSDRARVQGAFDAIERTGRFEVEYRIRLDDGSERWVRDRGMPVRDAQGHVVRVLGVAEDTTERRASEAALREREQRLNLALGAAHMSTWTYDVATGSVQPSDGMLALFGFSPGEVVTDEMWRQRIHPADIERVIDEWTRAFETRESFNSEYRIVPQPGVLRWVYSQAIVITEEDQRPVMRYGVVTDISERKTAEIKLFESERQARLITDAAPVGIARCSREWRYRFVNRWYAEQFLRMEPEDANGRLIEEVMTAEGFAAIQPHVRKVLAGEKVSYEAEIEFAGGPKRIIHVDYVPDYDETGAVIGWVSAVIDITDRRRAEGRLYKREREFETLVENAPDINARVDRDLRHIYINGAVERAFGVPREQFIGKTKAELKLPDAVVRACGEAIAATFEKGTEQPANFSFEREGKTLHFSARAVPEFDQNNVIESVLMIVYDVTDRINAQSERDALFERERAARAEAEAATQARDQFLAIVSHELRSPLNGIQSWAHVLESQIPEDAPRMRRAIQGIRTGVDQQVRLIEDLLDATRIMSGRLSIMKQPVGLARVIEAALTSVRDPALAKRITVSTQIELGEAQVEGDPDRLQQIVWNLLSNAVKFTPPEGRVELRARVGTSHEGARVAIIEIEDSGKGIPAEFLPQMFNWFRRSEAASNRSEDGLGLGLALVRHLCELQGGSVGAQSDGAAHGATLTVTLPLRTTGLEPEIDRSRAGYHGPVASSALTGVRVLVVDDQAETRDALTDMLTSYGAHVQTLASGKDAVAWIATQPPVDVLLCDIGMPDQDGHATLKQIREIEAGRGVSAAGRLPAIAMSAFTQREDRIRALATGFQVHIAKPYSADELVAVIATLAGKSSVAFSPRK